MARVSIEDCQKKLANRFALAMTAAHRTRQLLDNHEPLVDAQNKEAVTALREIAEGLITMEQVFPASESEEEKPSEEDSQKNAAEPPTEPAAVSAPAE